MVPLLAPLKAQSSCRLHFYFWHWSALQLWRQADCRQLFITFGIWKSWFWPFYGSALGSDGSNHEHDLQLLVTTWCHAFVQGMFLQPHWARQVLFPCLESWTSSRESVAHCLIHESKEEHSAEWQVAFMAHVAREGHSVSAEGCVEACEQPLWLRSKLDPKRLVKKNLSVVCEGFSYLCGVWQLLNR